MEAEKAPNALPRKQSLKEMRDFIRLRGIKLRTELGATTNRQLMSLAMDKSEPLISRLKACRALGDLRVRYAARFLVVLLEDDNPLMANAAANAIRYIHDVAVAPLVVEIIRTSRRKHARFEAVYTLGVFGETPQLAEVLIDILQDRKESKDIRARAASSLAVFAVPLPRHKSTVYHRRTIEALLKAMGESSPAVRYAATGALGGHLIHRRKRKVLDAYQQRARDSHQPTSKLAQELLSQVSLAAELRIQ